MFDIYKFQDYQIEDMELKATYYRNFLNGNIESAQNIYKNNEQLHGKVVEMDGLNQLLDSILSLEGYYGDNVTKYLSNELSRLQININNLILMGEFVETREYLVNNFVIYNGLIYFCYVTAPIGTLPTDTDYFIEIGLRGEKGNSSLGVNYREAWSPINDYATKDMVVHDNDLYVAISDNVGKDPLTEPTVWFKAVDTIPRIIFVGDTEPPGLTSGDIWVQILD